MEHWFEWMARPDAWVALVTLTALEIVLGIDNIVFISIIAQKLPEAQRARARTIGLLLALVGRVVLLFSISWVIGLEGTLFTVLENEISGRDLVLLAGGAFLVFKATREIHEEVEGPHEKGERVKVAKSFGSALVQIFLLDLVFSLDSVITAVGMADDIAVMVTAVMIAIGFMIVAASTVTAFIERHPTIKMLALSFLLLVGVALVVDGTGGHLPRGYIYAAMGFSMLVEFLNLRRRTRWEAAQRAADPLRG